MPTYATYRPQNSQSASQYFSTDTIEKMAAISSPNLVRATMHMRGTFFNYFPESSLLNRRKPEPEKTGAFQPEPHGNSPVETEKKPGFCGYPVPVEPENRVPIPVSQFF